MTQLFSWEGLLALFLGGLYGSLFGAIPGLTATLAVALFIPVAFFLDPIIALPAIISISSVAIFAGDVGSTVARIPGTPASAAYLEELYKMGKKKGPMYALGLSAMGSSVGGVFGTLLLVVSATGLAAFARQFSSFEYFWVAALGLTAGIFATGGSPLKSFASLLIGLLFSTIGLAPISGYPRFSFGIPMLFDGVNYIVAMIGLFGLSEVLHHLYASEKVNQQLVTRPGSLVNRFFIQPLKFIFSRIWMVIRSSLIGVFVGFLPGAGADIGAWVATSIQKMRGKQQASDEKKQDSIILSGTSSNNAAVASAWIPALALGMPGDTVTAIVLGVFMMKGITPGPILFDQNAGLVYSLYATFLISNVLLLPFFGFITARLASWLMRIPFNLLLSIIAGLCIVGAYAINNNPADIWIMLGMGVLAFFLKRGGFPLAQIVLGMVLGPILEENFMKSLIKMNQDWMSFFERPWALVFMGITILLILAGLGLHKRFFKNSSQRNAAQEEIASSED